MFKKLSLILCAAFSLNAFAAPADPIESDLAASVARAAKLEDEAKDVLRAAHVRSLKSRIAANEMAIRRLKTRLAITKDADAKVVVEARIAELEAETANLTTETQVKAEVTIGDAQPVQGAAAPAAQVAPGPIGKFSHIAGVWRLDPAPGKPGHCFMVISPTGELLTDRSHIKPRLTSAVNGVFGILSNDDIAPEKLVRVSPSKLKLAGPFPFTWTRVSAAVPPAEVVENSRSQGVILCAALDDAHEAALADFIKAHPLK